MTQEFTFTTGKTKQTTPAMCAVLMATDKQPTAILKESAALLMDDHREGSCVAMLAVLDCLESRMSEAEFVTFADTL